MKVMQKIHILQIQRGALLFLVLNQDQLEQVYNNGGAAVILTMYIIIAEGFGTPVTGSDTPFLSTGIPPPDSFESVSWEILPFTEDTSCPLVYTGSQVSQNQMVCYNMRLANLILPNVTLKSDYGGLIAFYPFVYVEITNETAPSGRQVNLLYSNNPHAGKATFRAAIDDTPTPVISRFIKIDGDGAVQTIKFKPNDNLKFRVFFGDGQTFQSVTPDTAPPEYPNALLQISALFEIERLS